MLRWGLFLVALAQEDANAKVDRDVQASFSDTSEEEAERQQKQYRTNEPVEADEADEAEEPDEAVEALAPGDMNKSFVAFTASIAKANNEDLVTEIETSGKIDEKFGIFNDLMDKIEEVSGQSEQESRVVAEAIETTIGGAQTALNNANRMFENQKVQTAQQTDSVQEVETDASGGAFMAQTGAETTLMEDAADFDGSFRNVVNAGVMKNNKMKGVLEKATMKEEAWSQKADSYFRYFNDQVGQISKDLPNAQMEGRNDLAKTTQEITTEASKVRTSYNEIAKSIKALPYDDKVIDDKDLLAHLATGKQEMNRVVIVGEKELQTRFALAVANSKTGYKDAARAADADGKVVVERANRGIKDDMKATVSTTKDLNGLGEDLMDAFKDIDAQTKEVSIHGQAFVSEVGGAAKEALAKLGTASGKMYEESKGRNAVLQGLVDEASANVNNKVGKEIQSLAGAVAEETADLSNSVMESTGSTSEGESALDANIGKDKTAGTKISSGASSTSAEVEAGLLTMDKDQREASDKAMDAVFELKLALSSELQNLRGGENDYRNHGAGELRTLSNHIEAQSPKIEQPVWAALESTLREVGDMLASAKIEQHDDLGGLLSKLKKIDDILARNSGANDQVISSIIPTFESESQGTIDRLKSSLESLTTERARTAEGIAKLTKLRMMDARNWMGTQESNLKQSIRQSSADRAKDSYAEMGDIARLVKNVEGRNLAEGAEVTAAQTYMRERLSAMENSLNDAQQKQDADIARVHNALVGIDSTKVTEMKSLGVQSIAAAREYIHAVMGQVGEMETAKSKKVEAYINADLSGKQAAAMETVAGQSSAVEGLSGAASARLTAALKAMGDKAVSMQIATQSATANATATLSAVMEASQGTMEEADRVLRKTQTRASQLLSDGEHMESMFEEETQNLLGMSGGKLKKERDATVDKLDSGLAQLFGSEGDMVLKADTAVENANSAVSNQNSIVAEVSKSAGATIKNVEDSFDHAKFEVQSDLTRSKQTEKKTNENLGDDIEGVADAFGSTAARNEAVITSMETEGGEMENQRDAAADAIADAVDAQSKSVHAETEAAAAGVQMAAQNAINLQSQQENDMGLAEKALYYEAKDLDKRRMTFENDTQISLEEFKALINGEEETLESNGKYLSAYERQTHQEGLNLIGEAVNLMLKQGAKTDAIFDDMLNDQKSFARQATQVMGGGTFQTLSKIMKTDQYVQKATSDDEVLVKYLENHEASSLPWMDRVLDALDDAHVDQKLEEEDQTRHEELVKQKQAGRIAGSVYALESDVANEGGGSPVDELSATADATATMLSAQIRQGGGRTSGQLNSLQSQADREAADNAALVAGKRERGGALFDELHRVGEKVNGMSGSVQKLMDYNTKLSTDERKRLASRAERSSNALFFDAKNSLLQGQATVTPDGQVESLVQTKPTTHLEHARRLKALIEENKQLTTKNEGLSHQHSRLGSAISDVVNLDRQLRQASI